MTHAERVDLIQNGMYQASGLWADLGCGEGAFTMALAELLHPPAEIYAVDENRNALESLRSKLEERFPLFKVHFLKQNFNTKLELPQLNGILMANALHYIRDKLPLIQKIHSYLKEGGKLILVEYNVKQKNSWVPYPISFTEWVSVTENAGFSDTKILGKHPSRYHHEIYATVSLA